jgi:diaminopropionate ammonia-lyase
VKLRTQPTNGYTLLTYNDHVCAGRSVTSHLPPLQPAGFAAAMEEISRWPDYRPTPLRSLAGLARHLGIGALYYKDESERFGLGSFKALGGAYAVRQLLSQRIGERRGIANVATEDLLTGRYADDVEDITVCTATERP